MLLIRSEHGWKIQHDTSSELHSINEATATAYLHEWREERPAQHGAPPVYHSETRNHPFLDMSRGQAAMAEDADIMTGYVATDAYPELVLDLPSDDCVDLLDAKDINIDEIRNHPLGKLSAVVSGAAGARRRQAEYYDPVTEYTQMRLLGKSVPSGGSRHPLETFLRVNSHPAVPRGFYYFHPVRHQLQAVKPSTQADAGVDGSALPEVDVEVYFAAYVHRAMFRYRDPRSFRALLVDAGHADAMVSALSAFVNWHYESAVEIAIEWGDRLDLTKRPVDHCLPLLAAGRVTAW